MQKLDIDRDRITPVLQSAGLRNESAILVAARTISHSEAARRLGLAKQTYQDWRDAGNLKDIALILAAYGQKIVSVDTEAYASADIEALAHLAQKAVIAIKPLPKRGAVIDEDAETEPGALGDR